MSFSNEPIVKVEDRSVESFHLLVERFQQRVFNTCYMMLRNREDAEDVAQEVFVEVYRSIDKYRGDASLGTWIYRISVNRCLDLLRRQQRKKRSAFAFQNKSNDELERLCVVTTNHPQQIMENKELEALLQQAIDILPERQRVAFLLTKMDGLKQDDVAQIMETTVSSVESLLIRAKKNMKEFLVKRINA